MTNRAQSLCIHLAWAASLLFILAPVDSAAYNLIPGPFQAATGTYFVVGGGGDMEAHSAEQITGWNVYATNWTDFGWSDQEVIRGSGSAAFRNPSAPSLPSAIALTKNVNVAAGTNMTISGYIHNGLVGGGSAYIDLNDTFWNQDEGGLGDCQSISTPGYGAWEFLWCGFTVPAAATQVTIRVVIEGNPTAGSVVYFDDIALTPTSIFAPPISSNTDDDNDGWTETDGDCDNFDATVYPGAPELPDGKDNDCDGFVDNGVYDDDGDGYCEDPTFCDDGAQPGDCVDNNPAINPGAQDLCDGIDNDCTGTADEQDDDNDGFLTCDGDCDDFNETVFPGHVEECDTIDNDCDGVVDEGLPRAVRYQDTDGDGWGDQTTEVSTCLIDDPGWAEEAGDCNNKNATVYPGAAEICDDLDNDCDGVIDNGGDCEEPDKSCSQCATVPGRGGVPLGLLVVGLVVVGMRRRMWSDRSLFDLTRTLLAA